MGYCDENKVVWMSLMNCGYFAYLSATDTKQSCINLAWFNVELELELEAVSFGFGAFLAHGWSGFESHDKCSS